MLKSLRIRNYAIIEELDVEFYSGFSVMTGETGAGKSIILGAMGLILGGRADIKSIKSGAEKCIVEAYFVFCREKADVAGFLSDNDYDFDGRECLLRREITKSGKSRAFINDTPATVSQLKTLGALLVDIHSQHENLLVSGSEFQMDVLDSIAGNAKEKKAYSACFEKHRLALQELNRLEGEISRKRQEEEYIRYSLSQFEAANLRDNEEEELESEQKRLAHAEEITAALTDTYHALDNGEGGVISVLRKCADNLVRVSRFLPEAEAMSDRINSVCIELRDINDEIGERSDHDEFDPARLQEVDARLSLIYDMERKHHASSYDELRAKEKELRSLIETLDDSDCLLAEKKRVCGELGKQMLDSGAALTATRKKAALQLSSEMVRLLTPLGMKDVRFEAAVGALAQAGVSGMDSVEYMFSSNKNSPMREIGTIASGGEIARIMLCLKTVMSAARHLPTIIFDEIDTGVSGRIAESMSEAMQDISNCGTQVICITHLPQIAASGAHHYRVYKQDGDGKGGTRIELLSADGRLEEVAKMLSGNKISEAATENARELLNNRQGDNSQ